MASSGPRESSSSDFKSTWTPDETFCNEGPGVEGEGVIEALRFHTVRAKDKVERYIAIILGVSSAFEITVDKYGAENPIDPNAYDSDPRALSFDQLAKRCTPDGSLLGKSSLVKIHPHTEGKFEFWALASTEARHFNLDDAIRFKTSGDSWFLKRFFHTKLGDFTGKEGGEVMSQMSKISDSLATMGNKLEQDLNEGCSSGEWSD